MKPQLQGVAAEEDNPCKMAEIPDPYKDNPKAAKTVCDIFRKSSHKWLRGLGDQCAAGLIKHVDENNRVPGLKLEKVKAARKTIDLALAELKKPKVAALLKKRGIVLRDTGFYMSIAIKETMLNPRAKGGSNDLGYFQIIPKFSLADVNTKILKPAGHVQLGNKDIYYAGSNAKKLATATKNNAIAGILYWHVCRDLYQKGIKAPTKPEEKDHLADFMYNLGPIYARNLWRAIKPKSFSAFAKAIARHMAKQHRGVIKVSTKLKSKGAYGVKIVPYALKAKPIIGPSTWTVINGKKYRTQKLLVALEYSPVVTALRNRLVI